MEGWGDGGLGISWASARASAYAVSSASSSGVGAAFFAGFACFAGVDAFAGFEDLKTLKTLDCPLALVLIWASMKGVALRALGAAQSSSSSS